MSWVECSHRDCKAEAHWIPALLILPNKDRFPMPSDSEVARAQVGMPLCATHKDLVTIDELVTPDAFAKITDQFRALGRVDPDPDIGLGFDELPKCRGSKVRPKCSNPAVVQVVWQGFSNSKGSVSLLLCSECLPDARRVLIEVNPAPGLDRQEFNIVPQELWRD